MAPPVPASKGGRPRKQLSKKAGGFGVKKAKSNHGRSRKQVRALEAKAKTATNDDDEHDEHDVSRDDEATRTPTAPLHLQVLQWEEPLQDTIECEDTTYQDYEDNHFLTSKVKEELDVFFDRKEEVRRMCVVYLFVTVHNANPDEATWSGKHGIINKIRKSMELPAKAQLDHVLRDALDHHRREGKKYEGKRVASMNSPRSGRPAFIDLKSIEAQIIADAMESGFDAAKALIMVNKHCKEIDKDLYV
jgi:hypothetical protein